MPGLIDEIPILAIAATRAEGETAFRGAAELRVKESDRIAALTEGLAGLGADVEALEDGLVVRGPCELREGEVDSRGDHRIAMSFAILALATGLNLRIKGWSSVETSFPGFLEALAAARGLRR